MKSQRGRQGGNEGSRSRVSAGATKKKSAINLKFSRLQGRSKTRGGEGSANQDKAGTRYDPKIERLLSILMMIQSQPGWTSKKLAEHFGIKQRTIFRDMKVLTSVGIPHFFDPQTQGYQLRKDFYMPPVELTLDEALAMLALAERVGRQKQIPFLKPATKAAAKIQGVLPAKVRQELADLDAHIDIHLASSSGEEGTSDIYQKVREAIRSRRALQCAYDSLSRKNQDSREPEELFLFHPYRLFFGQRAWYAVGWHEGRNEVRCLRLNRFSQAKLTQHPYRVPAGFSLDNYLGNAWRMIRGSTTYDVELHFDAHFADTIAETRWHPTQRVVEHDDGSITFSCRVDGLDEIVWWVLSMGPHCVVKKPAELAGRVQELTEKTLRHYRTDNGSTASAPSQDAAIVARKPARKSSAPKRPELLRSR